MVRLLRFLSVYANLVLSLFTYKYHLLITTVNCPLEGADVKAITTVFESDTVAVYCGGAPDVADG